MCVAQMAEHLTFNQGVASSNLVTHIMSREKRNKLYWVISLITIFSFTIPIVMVENKEISILIIWVIGIIGCIMIKGIERRYNVEREQEKGKKECKK